MSRLVLVLTALVLSVCGSSEVIAQTVVAYTGQTIRAGAQPRQILFRDKTSITASPHASITVQRAAYDSTSGTGDVVINVTQGAFRYVTGNSKGKHLLVTPMATVGVRGTVIEGVVANNQEAFALLEGAFIVCAKGGNCQTLQTPGTVSVVTSGHRVSPPKQIPAEGLQRVLTRQPFADADNSAKQRGNERASKILSRAAAALAALSEDPSKVAHVANALKTVAEKLADVAGQLPPGAAEKISSIGQTLASTASDPGKLSQTLATVSQGLARLATSLPASTDTGTSAGTAIKQLAKAIQTVAGSSGTVSTGSPGTAGSTNQAPSVPANKTPPISTTIVLPTTCKVKC